MAHPSTGLSPAQLKVEGEPQPIEYRPENLDSVKLQPFGYVFFNHLIGEYESFSDRSTLDAGAFAKAGELRNIYVSNSRPLTWGDLAWLECLILKLRSSDEVRERFWGLQRRFKAISPKAAFPELEIDKTVVEQLPDQELRARAEVFACEFFKLCILRLCREEIRAPHFSLRFFTQFWYCSAISRSSLRVTRSPSR